MKTNDNGRGARVRAARRLRTMTIGTAILGVAATGSFGVLAAITYDGTSTSTTSALTTQATGTTAQAAPIVTSTTRIAHVSSGGS